MNQSYDVVIVGAGPAGCTAAERLAAAGLDVAVLEEHSVIGEPVDCTGVVGTEAFEHFDLPRHIVLGSVDGVTIHSPAGIPATYQASEPLAYIVNRAELDRTLAARAQGAGTTFLLSTQAVDVSRDHHRIAVRCRRPEGEVSRFSAKILILAGGPRFAFHERLGLGTSSVLWRSAHAELPGDGLPHAQVYLGRDTAPGRSPGRSRSSTTGCHASGSGSTATAMRHDTCASSARRNSPIYCPVMGQYHTDLGSSR